MLRKKTNHITLLFFVIYVDVIATQFLRKMTPTLRVFIIIIIIMIKQKIIIKIVYKRCYHYQTYTRFLQYNKNHINLYSKCQIIQFIFYFVKNIYFPLCLYTIFSISFFFLFFGQNDWFFGLYRESMLQTKCCMVFLLNFYFLFLVG